MTELSGMSEGGLIVILTKIEGELAVIRTQQEANREAAERRYEQALSATEQARQTAELARLAAEQARQAAVQAADDTQEAIEKLNAKTASKEHVSAIEDRLDKVESNQAWVTRGIVGTVGVGVLGMLGLGKKIGL
jgi:uncharacterized UPF0160 family protein